MENYMLIFQLLSLALIVKCQTPDICTKAVCEYNFEIRRWQTMTYTSPAGTAYNVELNGTQLLVAENSWRKKLDDDVIGTVVPPSDVITGDGYVRDIITINGQFPGPEIHVMAGSQVVVHVQNGMSLEGTTIHWHGIHMRDTPWMDGAAYVTQCPILPRQKFTYRFIAEPWGTHWYHAHLGNQRLDGLNGLLVIHKELPTLPEYGVLVNDWLHHDAVTYDHQNPLHREKTGTGQMLVDIRDRDFILDNNHVTLVQFYGALINGRGRWNGQNLPLEEFKVRQDQRNRFRVVNTGVEYSLEVSIDNHQMDIVSLDGFDIQPITLDSLIIHTGETIDFEVEFRQVPDRYWMRVTTIRQGIGPYSEPDGTVKGVNGIIVYEGAPGSGDPTTATRVCSSSSPCAVFNCPFGIYPSSHYKTCVSVDQGVSTTSRPYLAREYGLDAPDEEVYEYFYNFAFSIGSSVNARKYVDSRAPFFRDDIEKYTTQCEFAKCDAEGCWCTSIDEIPFNKTIQIVLINLKPGAEFKAHHIAHLHGYSFAVLKVGYAEQNKTTGLWISSNQAIECHSKNLEICTKARWTTRRPQLNTENPPIKNNIIVPSRGYAVIRFRSTNPGYWFFHCHMEQHFMDGMSMVLNVAPDKTAPVPEDFPNCHDFSWTSEQFDRYVDHVRRLRSGKPAPDSAGEGVDEEKSVNNAIDDQDPGRERSDVIQLTLITAIGVAFGFIILGAVLPLLSFALYACCSARKHKSPK